MISIHRTGDGFHPGLFNEPAVFRLFFLFFLTIEFLHAIVESVINHVVILFLNLLDFGKWLIFCQLCKQFLYNEIECRIGIGDNDKQCCLFLPQCIKLQFIISSQVTQLLDVKWCQPRTTANQNRFCGLSSNKMSIVF